MTESSQAEQQEAAVDEWLTLDEVAQRIGVSASKVRQMARDHELAVMRRPKPAGLCVPAAFIDGGDVVKGLPGTLTVLADHGFSDEESIEWLFTADPSLPGTPIEALRGDRGREVRRRAQVIT